MASSPASPAPERSLLAVGARRSAPGSPEVAELIARLRAAAKASDALISLFDARAVGGERHLTSAWAHLGRSRRAGVSRLRDRGAELALYLAGDDQLGRALEKVGIGPSTEEFVLVVERPRTLEESLAIFALTADPTVYPREPSEATLERLGIGVDERSAVPRSGWEGLILERVALVDLAPGGSSATPARHPGKG